MSIDPLAEKYSYQSPYNFSENRVVDSRELEGLEAIHSTKLDSKGNTIHTLEKNVIVLTRQTKSSYTDKRNARIIKQNDDKVANVKSELNQYYSGATNSKGESVEFKFNVTALETNNTEGGTTRDVVKIGLANGIESGETAYAGAPKSIAPAAVITTDSSGAALGLTEGNVKISVNSSEPGVISS